MQYSQVQTVILLLITFLVTAGIKSISTLLGKDLSGYGSALTAGIVALSIGIFQAVVVPLIPVAYVSIIETIAEVLVLALGAAGIHKTVKSFQVVPG